MARPFVILVTLWTFIFVMPLCVSGAVHHVCDKDRAADCSHESQCAQDPCALKVVSGNSLQHLTQHHLISAQLVSIIPAPTLSLLTLSRETVTLTDVLLRYRQLYPKGAFPLLI